MAGAHFGARLVIAATAKTGPGTARFHPQQRQPTATTFEPDDLLLFGFGYGFSGAFAYAKQAAAFAARLT